MAETVQYSYDAAGRLSTVTNADSTTHTYHYDNASFPNALTGLTDESGNLFSTWGYDGQGRATSTSEAGGAGATQLTYNADGSVTVTDALGAIRTFNFGRYGDRNLVTGISGSQCPTCQEPKATTYNLAGYVASRTDYNNNVTQYTYDNARGLELSRTEAYGTIPARTITTQWHATFRLPTQVSIHAGDTAAGTPLQTTIYTHDLQGNVLTRTLTDPTATPSVSRTWAYTYNSLGKVLTSDGPRTDVSDVTTYTYYNCSTGFQCGQIHTIADALGHITIHNTYNAQGQPLIITDPNGVITTLTYDLRQRLTSRTVGTEQTSFEYWPTGLLKKVTLSDGSYLAYTYDAAHRLTGINDAEGNHIAYTLDAMGNRTQEQLFDPTNSMTQTRSRVFNTLNQLSQEIGAAGTAAVTTAYGYDSDGNQTSIQAPLSRNSTQSYDELNRLSSVSDPATGVTSYGYNALDQLISVTDPRGKVTSYTYNALGDLVSQVSPDTGTTTNTYDSGGNLSTTTDARGVVATYSYDALNRVTQRSDGEQTITYGYDQSIAGALSSVSDSSGSTSWTQTSQGRTASRTQVIGSKSFNVSYGYNGAGQLYSITTPSGRTITYGYTNNRISQVTVGGSIVLNNVLYEPFGPVSGWTWGNGTLTARLYDTDGNLTQLESAGLTSYEYDDARRVTGITDVDQSTRSWDYGYDLLDRLTSASSSVQSQSFTYDANGNRLTQGGTSASTYGISATSNRITSVSGALNRTYTYDNAGNVTGFGNASFVYNQMGRMASSTKAGLTTSYQYNALGQRVKKSSTTGTTYFVYDEAGHLLGEYDQNGDLVQETVWMDDTPVATVRWGSCGLAIFYVHTDHLNTPRRVTKRTTQDVVWRWDSDPFGASAVNENPSGLGTFSYNLRFPGQYYDAESGLNYNYFRDYDSATGRYIESDPAGLVAGMNTYSYVDGAPMSEADPLGLVPGAGPLKPPRLPPSPFPVLRDTYHEMVNKAVQGTDQYFHCLGNCRAKKQGSSLDEIRLFTNSKEYLRDYPMGRLGLYGSGGRMSHSQIMKDITGDQNANEQGLACPPNKTCLEQCSSLLDNLPPRYRPFMKNYRTVW